jgi:hypothetical protein
MAADRHFGIRHGTLTHRLKDEARRRSPPRLFHQTRTCQLKSPTRPKPHCQALVICEPRSFADELLRFNEVAFGVVKIVGP